MSALTYDFRFPGYRLQDSEHRLAELEVQSLVGESLFPHGEGIVARRSSDLASSALQRLTFFAAVHVQNGGRLRTVSPFQSRREIAARLARTYSGQQPWTLNGIDHGVEHTRKETSYATHGIHPFKGKFYPQLVGALLNALDVPRAGNVLDPFVGSGTTLIECALRGINGVGIDLHPLAAMLSRVKVELLRCDARDLWSGVAPLLDRSSHRVSHYKLPNKDYLEKWFKPSVLKTLEVLASRILALENTAARDLALVTLSSILRDVSLQEPKQLRIRRRPENAQLPDPEELFRVALIKNASTIAFTQVYGNTHPSSLPSSTCSVVHGDARSTSTLVRGARLNKSHLIDAVITSPPYATALPYIDTDRLSLHLLGLLSTSERRDLDGAMIGNREITSRMRADLEHQIEDDRTLPPEVRSFILDLLIAVRHSPSAGFRRQNMPALVFKYFLDMHRVLKEVVEVLRPGGQIAIVVGNNMTTIGRRIFEIETDQFLICIGRDLGLRVGTTIGKRLTSSGLPEAVHSQNAMTEESILFFQKPL